MKLFNKIYAFIMYIYHIYKLSFSTDLLGERNKGNCSHLRQCSFELELYSSHSFCIFREVSEENQVAFHLIV